MEDLIYRSISSEIEFKDKPVQDSLKDFEEAVLTKRRSTLRFLYYLQRFREAFMQGTDNKWRIRISNKGGFYFYQFMEKKFGLGETTIKRCCNVVKRFTNYYGACNCFENFVLKPGLGSFSLSKLFEMLSLTDKKIEEVILGEKITPDTTICSIREYVREVNGKVKKEKQKEDEEKEETLSVSAYRNQLTTLKTKIFDVLEKYMFSEDNYRIYNAVRGEVNALFNVLLNDYIEK